MNVAEGLARELVRVAELREHYREAGRMPNVIVEPAVALMSAAIEEGCAAAGSNDATRVLRAHAALREFEK